MSEEEAVMEIAPRALSQQLMALPAGKRLEAILARPDAAAVVAALPVQDFFFSVKELGPDDAWPLLALGEVQQLVHLFDLEWWEKDVIQPAKAVRHAVYGLLKRGRFALGVRGIHIGKQIRVVTGFDTQDEMQFVALQFLDMGRIGA